MKKTHVMLTKEHPHLQEPGAAPPIGPHAFQLCFLVSKKGQLVPNIGKHRAKKRVRNSTTSRVRKQYHQKSQRNDL